MSEADLKSLSRLREALQDQLPGDWRAFMAVAQGVGLPDASKPENNVDLELMIVSDHHNVVLQGRASWLVLMAQKYEFGGFKHD